MSRILVVDDEESICWTLREFLGEEGHRVETAASAEEALRIAAELRPDAVVLDVRLRQDSGLDLLDELRKRKATLPTIVMTGYADVPTSVRAFKGGAIDFLRKPVPPKTLVERIREAIEIGRRAREVAADRATVADRIARGQPPQRRPVDQDAAAIRPRHAGDDLDQGGLAGAVLAGEAVDLTPLDGERHPLQRAHRGEALADAAKLDQRGGLAWAASRAGLVGRHAQKLY